MRLIPLVCLALAVAGAAPVARALDLNSFRAEHHLPPLHVSAKLAGAAAAHARDMAARDSLDHDGFRARIVPLVHSAAAENVAVLACARPGAKPRSTFAGRACSCASADCVYRVWANSSGHRDNMLMPNVTHYGLGSATGRKGRRYWALELGN